MDVTETPIFISSIDREPSGVSRPGDFLIKFVPPLKLDPDKRHSIAIDRVDMVYSWYNITRKFDNDTLKYSHDGGNTWTTITLVDGTYSYSDIDEYIAHSLIANGHQQADDKVNKISVTFINTTYRVLVELKPNFQLDIRDGNFSKLLGFSNEILTATKYAEKLPDITNSIDRIHIKSSLVNDSIVGGKLSDTLYIISLESMSRGLPVVVEPLKKLFNPLKSTDISEARFRLVDSLERPVFTNGINWSMNLILKTEKIK